MPLISASIPNLINGVSQQPPSLRLKTQGEEQLNAVSSVVSGLSKRPGTEHLKLLNDAGNVLQNISNIDTAFIHTVRRDNETLNTLIVTNDGTTAYTYMFDKVGNPLTLGGTATYLNSATNPKADLSAVTIADYTYILNKKKVVAIDPALSPLPSTDVNRRYEALIYVKQGDYRSTYTLKARRTGNSWTSQSYTTGHSTNGSTTATQAAESSVKTDNIAAQLFGISLPSGINKTRYNNVIHLYSDTDFEVEVEDSRGNTHVLAFKEETGDFKGLPKHGPEDFTIKIAGDNEEAQDDYYVKLISDSVGTGLWKETIKPEITYQFDTSTMPHQIRRTGNTAYTFEVMPWEERKVGDNDSNPFPSFATDGLTLTDIFFHRNRLGMLYDENIILSESGEFETYNLFRRTVLTTVDSDPIDIAVSNNQVSILKHAVPFAESLLLFSEQTQFKLTAIDLLTPETATIDVTTQFEASLKAKPVGAGKYVFFPVKRGKWAGIREYFVEDQAETNDAVDVTAHIPQYIEGEITALTASTNEDTILCTTEEQPKTVYVYNYYWQDKQKLQASWGKWTFEGQVLNLAFNKSDILVLLKYDNGDVALEKINLSTDDATEETSGAWPVRLDRRVLIDGSTVSSVPYTASDLTYVTTTGEIIESTDIQAALTAGKKVFAGTPYEFKYVFSEQVVRDENEPITIGRLQIRNMNVVYNQSGFFEATVKPKGATNNAARNTYNSVFTGRVVGSLTNILNQPAISDGTFRINVMAQSQGVEVELTSSSHLPCAFQSAEWEGFFHLRSKRI